MNKIILRVANGVLILGTIVGILYPAFIEGQGISGALLVFFKPDWSQGFVMRWLVAFFFFFCLYVSIIGKIYKRIPITVIFTDMTIEFIKQDGSHVEIRREQLLRANRDNVTAYYSQHNPNSAGGSTPLDEMQHNLYCSDRQISNYIEPHGADSKGYEIIHVFGNPLPFAEYMPLIPIRFLRSEFDRLPNFIRKNLVKRSQTISYRNEFTETKGKLDFAASNYSQLSVRITLQFNSTIPKTLKVRRIQAIGMVEMHPDFNANKKTVSFYIRKFKDEKIRISWDESRSE